MTDPTPTIEGMPTEQPNEGGKSGYTPPATQKDLDHIITERVQRERAKYADYEDLKGKAARLATVEQANLSDLEKAQRTATEAVEAAAKATTDALRWKTAAKHGISDEDAETFLTGADEATITRQAETYAKRIAEAKGETAPGPRPDLTQSSTRDPAAKGTPEADFANFLGAQLGVKP